MTDAPILTVILLAGPLRTRAERMLRSVLEQSLIDRLEVILIDFEPDDVPPLSGSDHPAVTFLRGNPAWDFGQGRAEGVRMAHAPIVAFLEEHAWACPGWAEALVKAHEETWAGVGSEYAPANPHIGISDAVGVFNFPTALAPAARGTASTIPGHNSSYKRDLLLAFGDQLEALLLVEIVLQMRLQEAGHQLFIEPDSKFHHANETYLRSIVKGMFWSNRCLGAVRPHLMGWSTGQFLFRLLIAPLTPFSRMAKLFLYTRRQSRAKLGSLLRTLPLVLLIQTVAVAGHTWGMLFGMGRAGIRFRDYEISEPRQEPDDAPA